MIDLNKLRSDALKATQGEWRVNTTSRIGLAAEIVTVVRGQRYYIADTIAGEFGNLNASHIANNSPSTTLAFAEGIENAKRGADALARLLDDTQHAEHPDCEDGYCPVKDARSALAALREALKPFQKEAA